jgi:quercetin dioxygenase-like cupin family protein
MTSVRRTISLPPQVASRIERAAKQRGVSFSAMVADLASRAPEDLPYAGLVEDDEDMPLRFDEAVGRRVFLYGSRFSEALLTGPEGGARAACLHLPPGGLVGRHQAAARQLFCVVAGEGWVGGPDQERIPIAAGQAVCWERGEEHETGTETGLTAVVLEGDDLSVGAAPGQPGRGKIACAGSPRTVRVLAMLPSTGIAGREVSRRCVVATTAVRELARHRPPEHLPGR